LRQDDVRTVDEGGDEKNEPVDGATREGLPWLANELIFQCRFAYHESSRKGALCRYLHWIGRQGLAETCPALNRKQSIRV